MALRPYQYVEVDNFLHLRRRLTVSQFSSGALCNTRSWKESIVSPVLKAGKDATKPVSYRPISLLSNASKVVEKVVHSQLIRHCLDNRIIP